MKDKVKEDNAILILLILTPDKAFFGVFILSTLYFTQR